MWRLIVSTLRPFLILYRLHICTVFFTVCNAHGKKYSSFFALSLPFAQIYPLQTVAPEKATVCTPAKGSFGPRPTVCTVCTQYATDFFFILVQHTRAYKKKNIHEPYYFDAHSSVATKFYKNAFTKSVCSVHANGSSANGTG